MLDILNDPEDHKFEEEWLVIIGTTRAEYTLSKNQARILMQAIARKEKAVVFETFIISIPFIAEFYRKRRFLKEAKQLPARATELEYKPIDPKKFEEWKRQIYEKIGKPMPKS
jgi:uncharacterized protein (UPF0128 family)